MQRLRVAGALFVGLALVGTLSACGEDEKPATDKAVVVDVTVKDGKIDPNGDRIKVGVDQPIDLVVTADVAGSLHVHSDPEEEFAYDAGTETFKFQISRPGVVAVESHELDQIVVQLQVQ